MFWILGIALFCVPFLKGPDGPDPEGEDPGRLVSEIDIPFDEDVGMFEEDYELPLADAIAEASERWFGEDSELLASSGLVEVWRLEPGQRAYDRHCVGCHGTRADGGGAAASHLNPRPRNFRRGVFKFTSTASGERPLAKDVFQTITRGLAGSSMPDFRLVAEEQRWDLTEYVRWVSMRGEFEQLALDIAWEDEEVPEMDELAELVLERWSPEGTRAVYPPIPETPEDEASVERGRALYTDTSNANCESCHGSTGKGDGPSATNFLDGWGYPIAPRDLTTGVYRAGSEPADLYRSIATGINGTPMPSYGDSLSAEDIWDLVHFVRSLRRTR